LRNIRVERKSAAALFPPAHDEIVLENGWIVLADCKFRHAGSTMQEEQNGFCFVLAPDEHPLLHAIDVDVEFFRDAASERLAVLIDERIRFARTKHAEYADGTKDADKQNRECNHHDMPPMSQNGYG
jgi:hypothetical protein